MYIRGTKYAPSSIPLGAVFAPEITPIFGIAIVGALALFFLKGRK